MSRLARAALLSGPLALMATCLLPAPALAQGEDSFLPGLRFSGFGQVGYDAAWDLGGDLPGEDHNGFSSGAVDLFLSSRISERLSFLSEVLLGMDGYAQSEGGVLRLILRYDLHPRWNLQAGRLYTALGYWNERFQHGSWLQTSIGRPEIFSFSGSRSHVLPVHLVGVSARGSIDAAGTELRLTAEVGNGRSAAPGAHSSNGEHSPAKAFNLRLVAKPGGRAGLQLGAGLYADEREAVEAEDPLEGHAAFDEQIGYGFVAWEARSWEFLAEFVHVRHSGDGWRGDSQGWYAQLGRRFGEWTPYARFDVVELDETDPYYQGRPDYRSVQGGVRWDVSDFDAIKLQLGFDQQEDPVLGADQRTLTVRIENAFAF